MTELTTTWFELMYRDLGNMIHFSIFMMQIFPRSQKITIPKCNAVSFLNRETFSAAVKNNFNVCVMFDAACTLKLRVINPSYLKNILGWQSFCKSDPPVNAVK